MKIKQIELIGFKSFSEKTQLPLHEGITCIVGPNGCGKSNIVDAFRWVLGEQSAKSLRGEKMEEVIFQGSATKKQKAMAEVSLLLTISTHFNTDDNGSSNTSQDADEDKISSEDSILIARRLYRSGESEYLLNKKVCRLKDIRDILLDTGLDVKSYSILDQHRISEIVNSKPLDRRILIEEIAGVMKYKIRKAEAQSKLESSRENLLRIGDIIHERKRQMVSIDRQARKAERYKNLLKQAQELEIKIAKSKQSQLESELKALNDSISAYEERDSTNRMKLSEMQNKSETKKIALAEHQRFLAEMEQSLQAKQRDLAAAEKRTAVLKTQIENRKVEAARLSGQLQENQIKQSETNERLSANYTLIEQLLQAENALQQQLEIKSAALDELTKRLNEKEQEMDIRRRDIFKLAEEISGKKNELNKRHSHIEHLDYRVEVAERDRENLQKTLEHLRVVVSKVQEQLDLAIKETGELKKNNEELTASLHLKEKDLNYLRQNLSMERESLAGESSRIESLRELFAPNSTVSALKDSLGSSLKALSDIVIADKEHEIALEALLHEKISSLIVENKTDLITLLQLLRDMSGQRTCFLYKPININPSEAAQAPDIKGIIGRASDFIDSTEPENSAVILVKNQLSNTFVIDNLQQAIDYIEDERQSTLTFVTPQGDVLLPGGWIVTGKASEVLRFKREERELEASIENRQAKIANLEVSISTTKGTIGEIKEKLSAVQSLLMERDKKLSLLKHNLEEHNKDIHRKQRRLESLDMEAASVESERKDVQRDIEKRVIEIQQSEQKRAELQQSISSVQEQINALREQIQIAQREETNLRLQAASLSERHESLKKEQASLGLLKEELTRNMDNLTRSRQRALRLIEEEIEQINNLETEIKQGIQTIADLTKDYQSKKDDIALEFEALEAIEDSMNRIRTEIDDVNVRLTELRTGSVEKRLNLENLENNLREKYGVDIKAIEFLGEVSPEEESKLQEILGKMRDMGPVNMESITEYDELKKGYDFLIKQQEDLTLSISELEEAINRINSTTKRRLREAYNSLRERFNGVFSTLFGGGKADLILTEEENILESGLDIIAQPPGKKNQNLNQLSGGEKAMTSLALLFAGFLIKPSPLCILDEADAPLDESNTERFASMIKDLSRDTQFIIITHNRVTMEIADYLYGVTMEEPGVSKTIALQFAEYDRSLN